MITLEEIAQFIVPSGVVQKTDAQLRAAGIAGSECFVLWSGIAAGTEFHVNTCHVPRQTGFKFSDGLCVRVDGDELHRLNMWLYEHREILGVQVHSHPTEAYHSDTDDAFPMVTTRGGLSVVVPYFGRLGLQGPGVAHYRLSETGWDEVSLARAKKLITFEEWNGAR
jgi:hypothetical protein